MNKARKILIAEDDKTIRTVYKKYLTHEGFEVVEAMDGEQAGLMLLQHDDLDLVLMDVRMPVVDGSALFDLIKLHSPKAKVVVSSVFPTDHQRTLIQGADEYFDKTFGPAKLVSKVRALLSE